MTLPKINLRDLFWLVLVVAMGLGWLAHSRKQAARIDALEESWDMEFHSHRFNANWSGHRMYSVVHPDSDAATP